MNNFQAAAKEYRRGMHAAKVDVYECGKEYALSQHAYGLNGRTYTYCKAYGDYLRKYAK